ncbi:MAG: 3-deoxy-7-phosphoheptulonate synthase [Armatimonadetes bacterium]|nr:3-deoxy-7-phosphoheptulonate synthase [Armatimonadota bacterium]NIO75507.1 3-deoxy-7-phosphoheptulonate synthase [Armatimonadota bacterium]NIO95884.1 3-deoxy-7-phosphoheptulonate synthase [Armatimonadota bacterium]
MVIVMERGADAAQVRTVIEEIERAGFRAFVNPGVERKVIALLGAMDVQKAQLADHFAALPGVERVSRISEPYKLVARASQPEGTRIQIGRVCIGGPALTIIAGPCSAEDREQALEIAQIVKYAGANMLRGGAFKPRTSPYSFQGLGEKGLEILAQAKEETGLPLVTEVMEVDEVELVAKYADMLQIGARNMQNFRLLQRVGGIDMPVLLKRGPGCRVRDLLMAAEYIMVEGNHQIALCERGITTFEDSTRYTLDISAIPVIKRHSHLPVIIDPSHCAGEWRYVNPLAMAGVAAGADGLLVEVHPDPASALSDGPQALKPERFRALVADVARLANVLGRTLSSPKET